MQIKLAFVVKVHVSTGATEMLSTCARQMMFAWGQVYRQKNCCSVKELCIHSRENP